MNCKESFSQRKPCPFWGGDHCCDEEEYVDVESGNLQCRYNPSSVHINEYREITGSGEAELPASNNTTNSAISLLRYLFYFRLPLGNKVEDYVDAEHAKEIYTLLSAKQH